MEPVRADEELTGGIIHKAMFERLLLCDFAVADLTTANANVFYELGVRHAARPATTLAVFSSRQTPPFDVNYLRCLPYDLGAGNSFSPENAAALQGSLKQRLEELRTQDGATDSPVFQLLPEYGAPDIARLRTDTFRDRVVYATDRKQELARARRENSVEALEKIEESLAPFDAQEAGVLIDLMLSYRAVSAWSRMTGLYPRLPAAVQRALLVREQYGFALNREKRREEALAVLEAIVADRGPSSETCGLIGRVYKDQWMEAKKAGKALLAAGYLGKSIRAYLDGFEADWRDAYPGINAVTLLDLKGGEEAVKLQAALVPVVSYSVERRLQSKQPDYWDHATRLELAVLARNEGAVVDCLPTALAAVRESWEPLTTANNLAMIREARQARGESNAWLDEVIDALMARSKE
ncbi:MAG: DUF4071 domain-containing protein [Acidobacteria bacterium]|nr:DUF4071 domain-containing protein [Acidobacteriota bacterium]